jgi:hypothetical protein
MSDVDGSAPKCELVARTKEAAGEIRRKRAAPRRYKQTKKEVANKRSKRVAVAEKRSSPKISDHEKNFFYFSGIKPVNYSRKKTTTSRTGS